MVLLPSKNIIYKMIYLLLIISFSATGETIKPFTTDGCSLFPDGNFEDNSKWIECCIRHDYAYWKGGTEHQRALADSELKQCVANLGEEDLSVVMHFGVRLGGQPIFPTWYRWGYGWSYSRGYDPITNEEQQQINQRITELQKLLGEFLSSESSSEFTTD